MEKAGYEELKDTRDKNTVYKAPLEKYVDKNRHLKPISHDYRDLMSKSLIVAPFTRDQTTAALQKSTEQQSQNNLHKNYFASDEQESARNRSVMFEKRQGGDGYMQGIGRDSTEQQRRRQANGAYDEGNRGDYAEEEDESEEVLNRSERNRLFHQQQLTSPELRPTSKKSLLRSNLAEHSPLFQRLQTQPNVAVIDKTRQKTLSSRKRRPIDPLFQHEDQKVIKMVQQTLSKKEQNHDKIMRMLDDHSKIIAKLVQRYKRRAAEEERYLRQRIRELEKEKDAYLSLKRNEELLVNLQNQIEMRMQDFRQNEEQVQILPDQSTNLPEPEKYPPIPPINHQQAVMTRRYNKARDILYPQITKSPKPYEQGIQNHRRNQSSVSPLNHNFSMNRRFEPYYPQ